MCFVSDGSNIEITTVYPHHLFCVLYCKHPTVYGISLLNFLRLPEASVSGRGD